MAMLSIQKWTMCITSLRWLEKRAQSGHGRYKLRHWSPFLLDKNPTKSNFWRRKTFCLSNSIPVWKSGIPSGHCILKCSWLANRPKSGFYLEIGQNYNQKQIHDFTFHLLQHLSCIPQKKHCLPHCPFCQHTSWYSWQPFFWNWCLNSWGYKTLFGQIQLL